METIQCPECNGDGMMKYPYPSRLDPDAEMEWDTCHMCHGKKVITKPEMDQSET